ncbi:hypothetical protein BC835DRAFT_509546 [Cytidiella melzeri]|nr:hypothetical protein BC835DRAFT_509546 [Cytidiella melzeri]
MILRYLAGRSRGWILRAFGSPCCAHSYPACHAYYLGLILPCCLSSNRPWACGRATTAGLNLTLAHVMVPCGVLSAPSILPRLRMPRRMVRKSNQPVSTSCMFDERVERPGQDGASSFEYSSQSSLRVTCRCFTTIAGVLYSTVDNLGTMVNPD